MKETRMRQLVENETRRDGTEYSSAGKGEGPASGKELIGVAVRRKDVGFFFVEQVSYSRFRR